MDIDLKKLCDICKMIGKSETLLKKPLMTWGSGLRSNPSAIYYYCYLLFFQKASIPTCALNNVLKIVKFMNDTLYVLIY